MKKLILAGGGHGHINILKELIKNPLNDYEIILITDYKRQYYSGMLPGFIEGIYTEDEISFDVEDLCKKAGVKYINEKIVKISAEEKSVTTIPLNNEKLSDILEGENKRMYKFDFISMNLGSYAQNTYQIANSASYVKPIFSVVEFMKKIDRDIDKEKTKKKEMIIVGGGASGIELSYAFRERYPNFEIEVFSNSDILHRFNKNTRKKAKKELVQKKVLLHTYEPIKSVSSKEILTSRDKYQYDYLIVSNGVTGTPIEFEGYEVTDENFLKVENDLCADENSIAMGDMVFLKKYPKTPKAGVFAIRQAPILYKNLRNMLDGINERVEYTPQKKYLQLLNCGSRNAILNYGKRYSFKGKIPWKIKDYIDREYMKI